jgi:hypothetical protein
VTVKYRDDPLSFAQAHAFDDYGQLIEYLRDSVSRILDTTQIRRLIAFSSATDVTIQRFNPSTSAKRNV